jgi:PIN domain nuclease of toxin-antitoxin system
MNYILDTHILLWIVNDSPFLSKTVLDIYLQKENKLHLSMASIWEMAIKISLKKLALPCSLADFTDKHIKGNNISVLNIKAAHCYILQELPFHHRDPFDRLIIAQAIEEKFTVIGKDPWFQKYDIPCIF